MNQITRVFASSPKRDRQVKKFLKASAKASLLGFFAVALAIGGYLNLAPVQTAEAALQTASTIASPPGLNFAGAPSWYQDATGLALQPCLGKNPDGTGAVDTNCVAAPLETFITNPITGATKVVFDPTLPISFPNNYPQEAFYYVADAVDAGGAPLTVGALGVKANFRMALEEAFLGTADANGIVDPAAPDTQKITFLRLNLRLQKIGGHHGLTPNSVYTVNHPFGNTTCTTDAAGDMASCVGDIGAGVNNAFRAQDGGTVGGDFVSLIPAATTHMGPFLTEAAMPVGGFALDPLNPAAKYIGHAITPAAITPGPNGASFSISGPNVDGAGGNIVQANLWTVAGKIAVIDTIPPTIGATSPATVTIGTTNIAANVNITDNLFVGSATMDIGPLGNNFSTTLSGGQIVPPTASPATGNGTFVIDTAANTLSFNITTSGLIGGAETAAHIHGPAIAGANAPNPSPIFFDLPLGPSKVGVWTYPESAEADILAGRTYVKIHTVLFPAGEIRGQIMPQADVRNMILTAGTITNGTWAVVIPSATRLGTFNLPLRVSDGTNVTTGNFTLNVVPVLNSVTITPAASTIFTGATQQLTAAGSGPAGPITSGLTTTWTTSSSTIATVDANGLVTGVGPGIATITGTMTNGVNTIPGTAQVTVQVAPVLTSVTVTPAAATIAAGATQAFTASTRDQFGNAFVGATVTWTTDALPAVGTINPTTGVFTAVGAGGPATVTATAVSGATTVTGTATITVAAGAVCQTGADTNGDGIINLTEILAYIGQWKIGNTTINLLLQAIGFWKVGTGC